MASLFPLEARARFAQPRRGIGETRPRIPPLGADSDCQLPGHSLIGSARSLGNLSPNEKNFRLRIGEFIHPL